MDKATLQSLFAAIDAKLDSPATLVVYGASAFMLLGEEFRTSIDVDVAAPYCSGDLASLRSAILEAGYPINPPSHIHRDHIEWVEMDRLSLEPPDEQAMLLWKGRHLSVKTVSPPALIASKLIRYDETDQSDIRSLCFRMNIHWEQVRDAVPRLPSTFRHDAIVKENLENLRSDMALWMSKA
ncbi:MAG TPA: DUF6036 family nucleotidyltransferase [Kiritimatiellia bacterium]|nr:DUF6036 family nucleotidyltransferase [Kiritimatiellia bacterium]